MIKLKFKKIVLLWGKQCKRASRMQNYTKTEQNTFIGEEKRQEQEFSSVLISEAHFLH